VAAVRDNAWVGIDVGKTHHWVCAVDADGKTLLSVKVANDEAGIVSLIAAVTASQVVIGQRDPDAGGAALPNSHQPHAVESKIGNLIPAAVREPSQDQ
jgi:transposase